MNALDAIKNFAKKLGLIREVWVNDKEGDKVVISKSEIESLQEDLKKIKELLGEVDGEIKTGENSILDEIDFKISVIEKAVDSGNVEAIARVSAIFDSGLEQINKLGTLKVGEFKEQARGGDISVISTEGYENQPKDKEDKETGENSIGGAIVSRKNKAYEEELEGEHIKKDETLKIIDNILDAAVKEIKDIEKGNSLDEKQVSSIIKKNFNKILENVKNTAKKIPEIAIKGVAVKSKNVLTKRAIALLMTGTFALGFIGGLAVNKNNGYSIPIQQGIEYNIDESTTDELIKEAREAILAEDTDNQNALKEENDNGSGTGVDPELESREELTKSIEKLNKYEENIEQIKKDYQAIKNPTNEDFIQMQQKILQEHSKIIDLIIDAKEGDIDALSKWIDENNEHIAQMTDQTSIDQHKSQNDNSKALIEELKKEIEEMKDRGQENSNKINFYSEIQELQGLEEVDNVEDFSEALYKFSTKYEIDPANLVQELNDKGVNLNLFVAHAKHMLGLEDKDIQDKKGELEVIIAEYALVENTHNEYVERYGETDYSKYVNYFHTAKEQYMKELGEEGNFIEDFFQRLDQDNMNDRYYEQTTGEKVSGWGKIKNFFITLFDGTRSGEYNKITEDLNKIGDLSKDGKSENNNQR